MTSHQVAAECATDFRHYIYDVQTGRKVPAGADLFFPAGGLHGDLPIPTIGDH